MAPLAAFQGGDMWNESGMKSVAGGSSDISTPPCNCKNTDKRLDKLGLLKETPAERALRLSREREKYRGAKDS